MELQPIPLELLAIGHDRIGCASSRDGKCDCTLCQRLRRNESIDPKGDILREKIVRCGKPDKESKLNLIVTLKGE